MLNTNSTLAGCRTLSVRVAANVQLEVGQRVCMESFEAMALDASFQLCREPECAMQAPFGTI